MASKHTTRFTALLGILTLLLIGLWQLYSRPGDFDSSGLNVGDNYDSAHAGQRTMIPAEPKDSTPDKSDVSTDESLDTESKPKRSKRPAREPRVKQRQPTQKDGSIPEEKETHTEHQWLVVNEFGQPVPEAEFVLAVDHKMELLVWELESNSMGLLNLTETELSDEMLFRTLQAADESLLVDPLAQEPNQPLQQNLVIRVVKMGTLRVRLTDASNAASKLSYSALLFPYDHGISLGLPKQVSKNSIEWGRRIDVCTWNV